MAFTDFILETVNERFALTPTRSSLFAHLEPCKPSNWLIETLARYQPLAFTSEKSRSEFIIAPILSEARETFLDTFSIYSGQRLDIDTSLGLTGECDFIFAKSPPVFFLRAPIVSVVEATMPEGAFYGQEAKKQDVEVGLGQCVAQLLAAQQFNQKHNSEFPVLYGCVTTGEVWQFLRLEDKNLTLDTERFTLDVLPELLGAFKQILQSYL
jgi:hypothetical protein